jgi:hypothetical protein
MSTLSEGKVLEKFSTAVAVQGQIGELAGLYPPPTNQISWRRSICCENFMSTLSKGKVLEKFSNELEVQWQIGELWWEWGRGGGITSVLPCISPNSY